jgi:hypothetical protein
MGVGCQVPGNDAVEPLCFPAPQETKARHAIKRKNLCCILEISIPEV